MLEWIENEYLSFLSFFTFGNCDKIALFVFFVSFSSSGNHHFKQQKKKEKRKNLFQKFRCLPSLISLPGQKQNNFLTQNFVLKFSIFNFSKFRCSIYGHFLCVFFSVFFNVFCFRLFIFSIIDFYFHIFFISF